MLELGRKSYLKVNVLLLVVVVAVMERLHFLSEETIRLLLSEIFKPTTKKVTLLLFHAKHASQPDGHIIIHSPAHRWQLKNKQLY